jgi:hypothetical protein
MLQDIIIFMQEIPNTAHLKGWAMKIVTFKGPKMALAIARAI